MDGILAELGGLGPLTASGMVLLAVWLIFRGKLVPRLYYEEMRASRDKLQAAVEKRDGIIEELVEQQKSLVAAALTTKKVIEALPPPQGG